MVSGLGALQTQELPDPAFELDKIVGLGDDMPPAGAVARRRLIGAGGQQHLM